MTRPLMRQGIAQLEALYSASATDLKSLKQLQHELKFRQVPRAVSLLEKVEKAFAGSSFALAATPVSVLSATPAAAQAAGPAASFEQPDLWGSAPADRVIAVPRLVTPPSLAVRSVPAAAVTPPLKKQN